MVPNSSPRAFEGVRSPLQMFFPTGLFVDWELFYFFYGGCVRAHPPGVAPEPFGGMVLFLQRLLPQIAIARSSLGIGCVLFTHSACPHGARKPPSPFPVRVDQVLSCLVITPLILPFARRWGGSCRTTLDGRVATLPGSCKRVDPSGCPSPIR